MIIHMSGAQSSEVLERARDCGARVVSIHPLQAFASPEQAITNLAGSISVSKATLRFMMQARRVSWKAWGANSFLLSSMPSRCIMPGLV